MAAGQRGRPTIDCIRDERSDDDMTAFTGRDPAGIHHGERDAEFLIELPRAVQVLRLRPSHGDFGQAA